MEERTGCHEITREGMCLGPEADAEVSGESSLRKLHLTSESRQMCRIQLTEEQGREEGPERRGRTRRVWFRTGRERGGQRARCQPAKCCNSGGGWEVPLDLAAKMSWGPDQNSSRARHTENRVSIFIRKGVTGNT